jgi:hypothetical protein
MPKYIEAIQQSLEEVGLEQGRGYSPSQLKPFLIRAVKNALVKDPVVIRGALAASIIKEGIIEGRSIDGHVNRTQTAVSNLSNLISGEINKNPELGIYEVNFRDLVRRAYDEDECLEIDTSSLDKFEGYGLLKIGFKPQSLVFYDDINRVKDRIRGVSDLRRIVKFSSTP